MRDSSRLSSSKQKKNQTPSKIDVVPEVEDTDSLDRSPENIQKEVDASVEKGAEQSATYTDQFISESIASGSSETEKLKSASVLASKIEESAGYSEQFEDISASHTMPKSSHLKPPVEPVKEEDSALQGSSHSSQKSISIDDKEILESSHSVQWQIQLQQKIESHLEESEQELPTGSDKSPEVSGDMDELMADHITDSLMEHILTDFMHVN